MRAVDVPGVWVGRADELAIVGNAVDAVIQGEGRVLWVEGEPGIGKSALVAAGLHRALARDCSVFWGTAHHLSQKLPLRVVLDCLEINPGSADPRRAAIADYLRDQRAGLVAINDPVYAAAEMALALVDELCTSSPTALVVDDLQWADEASLTVWHRLALVASQLPLLLIGICHPVPRRRAVGELRATMHRVGGTVISLGPLSEAEVDALAASLGSEDDHGHMAPLLASAMGNPLYVRELVAALDDECSSGAAVANDGTRGGGLTGPASSFANAVRDRLSFMPPDTIATLRAATLLGGDFAMSDLAIVLRQSALQLSSPVQDALAAGVITEFDTRLAFRHELVRQVIYESMPAAMRGSLHSEAAKALAEAAADSLVVAQQLAAAGRPGGLWARTWLVHAAPALVARAPELGVEVLKRELDAVQTHDSEWAKLTLALTRALLELGRNAEGVARARQALAVAIDPEVKAETWWLLARALFSMGSNELAVGTVMRALREAELPGVWQARLLASLAMFQRASTGDLDAADATARQALQAGKDASDAFATSYALVCLWLTQAVRRDHLSALDCLDQARASIDDTPSNADMRAFIRDARIFTMQNLDRWPDAELTLGQARAAGQQDDPRRATPSIAAAVLMYWIGRWDDALAELGPVNEDLAQVTYTGLRERGPMLLWHGVAALISAHREDHESAATELRAGLALPLETVADRENSDFLAAAHALIAEQEGDLGLALAILSTMTTPRRGEMTLVHQWLPDLVRTALLLEDRETALAALRTCEREAAAETTPARATAASWHCAGLFHSDPAELSRAVSHYRSVGPPTLLGCALEDLAVVLADQGRTAEAKSAFAEAVDCYTSLGATWDLARAERRLRAAGIRRGVRGPRKQRSLTGWDALTPTELTIAGKIAQGQSTPMIAESMFLSRRTVQTHISHTLNKIGGRSRVDIAREALRRGTAPAQGE